MSTRERWIDTAMATYEGSSPLCGFCEDLFHLKLVYRHNGAEGSFGRTSEGSRPYQSVENFECAVSFRAHYDSIQPRRIYDMIDCRALE